MPLREAPAQRPARVVPPRAAQAPSAAPGSAASVIALQGAIGNQATIRQLANCNGKGLGGVVQRKKTGALALVDNETIVQIVKKSNPALSILKIAKLRERLDDKFEQEYSTIAALTAALGLNPPDPGDEVKEEKGKASDDAFQKVEVTIVGPIADRMNRPVAGQPVFSRPPGFIDVLVDGKPRRLIAGQDYLNDQFSAQLMDNPDDLKGEPAQLHPTDTADVLQVGNGHHRLVWGLFHARPVAASLYKLPVPKTTTKQWGELLYKATPDNLAVTALDDSEMAKFQQDALVGYVSPDSYFQKLGALRDIGEFVANFLQKQRRTAKSGQVVAIVKDITAYVREVPTDFYKFVGWLSRQTKSPGKSETLMETTDFPLGAPAIVIGRAKQGTGQIVQAANVIVLDRIGNPNAEELLDTLLFETQNARNLARLREARTNQSRAGILTAEIEYDTTAKYVEALQRSHRAKDIGHLAELVGIPRELLVDQDERTALVEIPKESQLPRQEQRTVLFFFKTRRWDDRQRREAFGRSAHSEGAASTAAGYAGGKKLDLHGNL